MPPATFTVPGSPLGWLAGVVLLLCVGGLLAVALFRGADGERRRSRMLAVVTLAAVAVLVGTTAWLIAPGAPTRGVEAIRSAALASGAVLAFYALWLNDQRRRIDQDRLGTEEARRDIEDQRRQVEAARLSKELDQLEYERDRTIEDRFAKAVELLGHAKGQTRVGALTMLAGVAHHRPEKAPQVLDQLCAYLRWPVEPDTEGVERHVRRTTQRLLTRLLAEVPFDPPPVLDLTGARLVDLELPSGTRLAELRLDGAHLSGTTTLAGVELGVLSFDSSHAAGEVDLSAAVVANLLVDGDARFEDRLNLRGARLGPELLLRSGVFGGSVQFGDAQVVGVLKCHARVEGPVDFTGAAFRAVPGTDLDGAGVLLDLSGGVFGGLVTIADVAVAGLVRLDGATFDGGLVLLTGGTGVWADNVLVADGSRLTHPPGWHTTRATGRPGHLLLIRR